MTLTFNLRRATVITPTYAKYQGQRLVDSKSIVETVGQTDTTDRITYDFTANTMG